MEVNISWEQSEQNWASAGLEDAEWRRVEIRMEEQYLGNCMMDNRQNTVICLESCSQVQDKDKNEDNPSYK